MARLAFLTFGILRQPYGSPVVQGFVDATPDVFREIESSPGYLTQAVKPLVNKPSFGQVFGEFGAYAVPRFYKGSTRAGEITVATTLSLWTSINAVRRFAYRGLHKKALDQRADWFLKPAWPTYVMWWVADDHTPSWHEASERLECLHDHGPTRDAFNFGTGFDAEGIRISVVA
jgi:hypothetical protein